VRSNRRKAIIRWLLGVALAGVILLPFAYKAVSTGEIGWWEACGSGYFILLSGLHRITDTQTVNNWLIKIDLGKDDIRSLRKKAQDRRDRRHELDEPPYSGE
jgi:hypothetical protein